MKKIYKKTLMQKSLSILLVLSLLTTNSNLDFLRVDVYAETMLTESNEDFDNCIISDSTEITQHDSAEVTNAAKNVKTVKATKSAISLDMSNYVVNTPVTDATLTIKTYGTRTNLEKVNTYRGDMAIREYVPFELKAGDTITLKQTGGLNQHDLTVQLKTGLSTNESQNTIKKTGTEVTLTAVDESICYIRVPRSNFNDITISYSISNATSLPIFTLNETDEAKFFAEWDSLNTEFSIIQNDTIIMQIPKMNKEYLRTLKSRGSFNDINHLLTYYKEMLEFYDVAYGLDGSTSYNANPKQKYLAVPEFRDTGGIVGTYETEIVRAYGTSRGMLKMLDDSWLAKHELGHGYQGDMMDWDVSVREIWNNIPSHYYSMVTNSNTKAYRNDYINKKPGNQKGVYEKSVRVRNQGASPSYNLEFFREIFDQYGLEVFIKFNQEYRRQGVTGVHDDMSNSNQFARYFSEYAGVDLVPYFKSFNFNIDDKVIAANADLPNSYYLTDLVKSQTTKDYIIKNYNLVTEYSLIDTSIFSKDSNINIRSNATINFSIDDNSELNGKQVLLKNGDFEYYSDIVNGKAVFKNLPIGVYKLFTPLTNSGSYTVEADDYLYVAEGSELSANVTYSELEDFYLNFNYKIDLRSDANYTPLTTSLTYISDDNYNLHVGTLPDRYNPSASNNNLYAYLKVFDENGNVVKSEEFFNLTPSVSSSVEIPVKPGYKLAVYRTGNKARKIVKHTITNQDFNDASKDLLTYDITEAGLVYTGGSYGKSVTDKFISNGLNSYFKEESQYLNSKERIYLHNAIGYLSDSDKTTYLNTYAKYLRVNNPVITTNSSEIEVEVGGDVAYSDIASATDREDGVLDSAIFVKESDLDTSKVGKYSTTLRVEDSDHNFDEITVSINVKEKVIEKPVVETPVTETPVEEIPEVEIPEVEIPKDETPVTETPVVEIPKDETPVTETPATEVPNTEVPNTEEKGNNTNSNSSNNSSSNNTSTNNSSNSNTSEDNYNDTDYIETDNSNTIVETTNKPNHKFIDIDNSWAKSSIEYVADKDILKGVTKTTFEPKTEVSRAMTATVLGRMSGADAKGLNNTFDDVKENVWYTDYVNWATDNDIVKGINESKFNPSASITREELAVAIENYLKYSGQEVENTTPVTFFDDSKISSSAKSAVYNLRNIGIIKGDTLGNFNPKSNLTRAELSAILERVVKYSNK